MNILQIAERPISVTRIPQGASGVHESTLRAYQILEYVKYLLRENTPGAVILRLIYEMDGSTYNPVLDDPE